MSDKNIPHKKKPKSTKQKTSHASKSKPKKRKSRPTREYQATELEVQALLQSTSLSNVASSSSSHEYDALSRSLEFFCGTSEDEPQPSGTNKQDATITIKKDQPPEVNSSSDEADKPFSASSSEHSQTPPQQNTASTYIQIDDDVLVPRLGNEDFRIDASLLYQPTSGLPVSVSLSAGGVGVQLTRNILRMLHRFCIEAQTRHEPLPQRYIELLQQCAVPLNRLFCKDPTLYRSFCEHEFHVIFCPPTLRALEIPTRKLLRIYFRELRFSEHPCALEEHQLCNTLEDKYDTYRANLRDKRIDKLRAELQIERNIVNELLRREASAPVDVLRSPGAEMRHARNLEQHLLSVRALRNRLHEEEATQRQLLNEILDAWLQLKQLRNSQQFQCTRLKLRLYVRTPQQLAVEQDNWAKRFQTELNEIYREELESYYRAKRHWQAYKSGTFTPNEDEELPVKPKRPSLATLSKELKHKLTECLPAPGEPKIEIQLQRLGNEEFYNMSTQRKLKSYFLKIYFDGEYVSATRSYRLEPDLRVHMNEVFGIVLERRLPKQIQVVLYEKIKLNAAHKIADISVPLSYPSNGEISEQHALSFASQRSPNIKGRLCVRLQCTEETASGEMLQTPTPNEAPIDQTPSTECKTIPDEHANALTCTFEEELLQFCPIEELEHNARFRLLRSRYLKNEPRTRELCFIPALDNELEFDWEAAEEPVIDTGNWMDPIDLHKHEGKKYLKSLYEAIRTQCLRLSTAAENAEHALVGDEPASWSSFFQTLGLIFNPKRPLPGAQSMSSSNMSQSLSGECSQSFRVILNVVRATGIPVRTSHTAETDSRHRSSDSSNMFITQIYKYSNVRPFIALSYKDKLARTLTAEGSNPTWNEQLVLHLSGSLADLRNDIKIILFDELIEQHVNDEVPSVRNMDIYQRIQTNWLGEYRLPISALLAQKNVECVLELHTPKVLLGYKPPSLESIAAQADVNIPIEHYPEIKETVRLWCYLSIEPNFTLPRINTGCLECAELKEVRQHLQAWSLQARELKPLRFVEPLVCTEDGKRVCLTRLLEPIPLPLEASENLLESVCRFVSLLNVPKCYEAYAGFQGIWLNNQTLLDTNWGSAKDLGVLLCNFLLTIGMPTWLVLGMATSYGECAFVLYRNEEGELLLIDPGTGKRYGVKDVFCPLTAINFVVTSDNLYCNIQSESRVTMTNFNFKDSSCWLPAFSKRNPAPLGGIQKLNYNYSVTGNTFELRRNIERKIMKKISAWRNMRKTIWNRAFQQRLQNILHDLEHLSTFANGAYTETRYTDQLAAEFPQYKIYGFTLQFPYTNLTSISDRIKSTGLHLNSDKNVEFSLAVHLHIYPNDVLSVWIFIISLIPARPT